MVLSTYEKQRILYYYGVGLHPSQIQSALRVENIHTCRQTVARFLKRFLHTGTICRKEGSGRPSKITDQVLVLVEQAMTEDDETTATQLHILLTSCTIRISLATILRSRNMLGWTFRVKHLPEVLAGGFDDVIYTDETTVQLESHRRHSYRKKGQPATLKPRPKHPIKVHVWAGISKRGPTPIVIF